MMLRHALMLLSGCVALCGCDPLHGVDHLAYLAAPPPADCVRRVLSATPQITFTDRWEADGLFTYQGTANGQRFLGRLQAHQQPDGQYRYSNGDVSIGMLPSQMEVDAIRPILRTVDAALAEQCGLTTPVKEVCYGVECKAL